MKKYILLAITSMTIVSCGSDGLSNSKAEDIITNCLKASPEQRTAHIRIGKTTFSKQDHDQKLLVSYSTLAEGGYIEMILIKEITRGWNKGTKEYDVSLKEKALEYMEEVPENKGNAVAKTFNYEVDEVLEVHEIPSMNQATAKVNFKAANITPFAILSNKKPSEFWVKKLKFTKTSNGWKYCDDF